MSKSFSARDRAASRATLRLFAETTMQDKWSFVAWLVMRPLALLIYTVLIPFQIAYALQAIITRQFDEVAGYVMTIVVLGCLYAVLWGLGGVAICRNGRIGTSYIQQKVFANYLEKDYEFFNNQYIGTLGSQATQLRESYNRFCTLVMNGLTRQVVVVTASIAIIAWNSPLLALVTLVAMAIIMSFTILSSRWRLKYRRLLGEASGETAGIISDALSHGTTVKGFAREDREMGLLDTPLQRLANTQYWSWMSSIPADIGRLLLAVIATVVLLLLTSSLYRTGAISIAIVVLVQLYVIRLVNSTQEIADLIKDYEAIMSTAHQAVKTMLVPQSVLDSAKPKSLTMQAGQPLTVEFDNVSFSYHDGESSVQAVENFSLRILQGEKIGLVGYSGSGKTTLTKLLLRFMDVENGNIRLAGNDIRDIRQKDLRDSIAYVPQEPLLFHRSILENIAYGRPKASEADVHAAGVAAYVDEFVDSLAQGYDTFVGEKGVKLSGGQRQRVAIARALLKDAPILVLDEATSALDSRSEQFIQKALWRLMKGRTVLVIAHRLSTIQRMDLIVVMDKGRIVATGKHDELLKDKDGIYAKLWQHQSGGYIQTL